VVVVGVVGVPRHGRRGHGGGGAAGTRARRSWVWTDPPLALARSVDCCCLLPLVTARVGGGVVVRFFSSCFSRR
jgi:hypothetical protein